MKNTELSEEQRASRVKHRRAYSRSIWWMWENEPLSMCGDVVLKEQCHWWVLNGKQPCRVTENTHSLYCCLADELIGQIVFTVIHEWIPLLVLSHHGSYVTFCIFSMADRLSRKCNTLNVSWPFSVPHFQGFESVWKTDWQEMSDFRCQATICYHLLETVGLDLSMGEQNVRVHKSMQSEVWVFVCVVVVVGGILYHDSADTECIDLSSFWSPKTRARAHS